MSAMQPEQVAELVAKTLAHSARRASLPALAKIAWAGDTIAVEAIDGTFFTLTVAESDPIDFDGDDK